MKYIFLIILCFNNVFLAQAQVKTAVVNMVAVEEKLADIATTMIKDTFAPNRLKAAAEFKTLFLNALQQKDAFKYPFAKLEMIPMQAPMDSAFRIFTWQIVDKEGKSTYEGVIQTKAKKPKIFPFEEHTKDIENPEFEVCTPENWYGGIYYNMKEYKGKFGKQYLLFGYNQNAIVERTKFVDVLTYRNGKFTFGSPVFTRKGKETRTRLLLVYGAEGKARMNFDEASQQIIFDHLVSVKHELLGMTLVPDGDFEGYKLDKGFWTYVSDAVKTTIVSEPIRPFPILEKRKGKNVFGKKKKY